MRRNRVVEQLLDSAQHGHRCAYACNRNERVALARRARSGELNQVFRNCYVRPDYWDSLRPAERTWHICRTVNQYNPGVVFAGKTAATLLGFPLSHAVHDGTIVCAARRNWTSERTQHIYTDMDSAISMQGLLVTNPAHTLVDCALLLPFEETLPMFDSASTTHFKQIMEVMGTMSRDVSPVLRLLHFADPRSESGGESKARAVIIVLGFVVPELQISFFDPVTRKTYRTDYLWRLADGRAIVGEFDGMEKYVNPQMVGSKTIEQRVLAERERDEALRRCGVSQIVHFSYNAVMHPDQLRRKLEQAGVPYVS